MGTSLLQSSFTSGEFDSDLSARLDVEKYRAACRHLENFLVQPHGGTYRRPGLEHIAELSGTARLIPFEFNVDQTFILVFIDEEMYVIKDDGTDYGLVIGATPGVAYQLSDTSTENSPYGELELRDIYYTQSADVMYIAHPLYAPMRLIRIADDDWDLDYITFGTGATTPSNFTSTVTGHAGGSLDTEYAIVFQDEDGEESLPLLGTVGSTLAAGEWLAGDIIAAKCDRIGGASDDVKYFFYKKTAGDQYGFIGVSDQPSGATVVFDDFDYAPDVTETIPTAYDPFGVNVFPTSCTLHQQRLFFANGEGQGAYVDRPQTLWGSQTGLFTNFNKSFPLKDSDSVEYVIASHKINNIEWLLSFDKLLVGTSGSEWVFDSDAGSLTPSSVRARAQSYWGSSDSAALAPIIIGNSILHIQRQGNRVRDMTYSLETDGYVGNDLSVLAGHLFRNHDLYEWSYQEQPDSVLWCIREDGVLLAMTYLKEYNIWAWHRHSSGRTVAQLASDLSVDEETLSPIYPSGYTDNYQSVASIPNPNQDVSYFMVKRLNGGDDGMDADGAYDETEFSYHLERMDTKWTTENIDEAFFVDSGIRETGGNVYNLYSIAEDAGGDIVTLEASHGNVTANIDAANNMAFSGTAANDDNDITLKSSSFDGTRTVIVVNETDLTAAASDAAGTLIVDITELTGYTHLADKVVDLLVDGVPYTGETFDGSGDLTLPTPGLNVIAGIGYASTLSPMPIEFTGQNGTTIGLNKLVGETTVRFDSSVGGKYGPDLNNLDPIKYTPDLYGNAVPPFTGDRSVFPLSRYSKDASFYLVQDQPLPMRILAIVPRVSVMEG